MCLGWFSDQTQSLALTNHDHIAYTCINIWHIQHMKHRNAINETWVAWITYATYDTSPMQHSKCNSHAHAHEWMNDAYAHAMQV